MKVNAGHGSIRKRVVYLQHGLLMNSEVWVSMTDQKKCLPFVLVMQGFDVWVCLALEGLNSSNLKLMENSWESERHKLEMLA